MANVTTPLTSRLFNIEKQYVISANRNELHFHQAFLETSRIGKIFALAILHEGENLRGCKY